MILGEERVEVEVEVELVDGCECCQVELGVEVSRSELKSCRWKIHRYLSRLLL